jgi:integrase
VADGWRSKLMSAYSDNARFDIASGLPVSWLNDNSLQLHEWLKEFLATRWADYQPNTRRTTTQAYVYCLERLVGQTLTAEDRNSLADFLVGRCPMPKRMSPWATKVPRLGSLEDQAAKIRDLMFLGVNGGRIGRHTGQRNYNLIRHAIDAAVEAKKCAPIDWPTSKQKRRKAATSVKPERALTPAEAARTLEAMTGLFRAVTAVTLYAGLRPGEVWAITGADVNLKKNELSVRSAIKGANNKWGTLAEDCGTTKTEVERVVPLTPQLAAILSTFQRKGFLFRMPDGTVPAASTWARALAKAAHQANTPRLTPYAGRHYFATQTIKTNSLPEVARAMGTSVEMLVRHYVHTEKVGLDISSLSHQA